MADQTQDVVLLRLPTEEFDTNLVADLPFTGLVQSVRGADLAGAVTVVLDSISATSGLVTLAVAQDELAVLGRRLMHRLQRKTVDFDRSETRYLELTLKDRSTRIEIRSENPNDAFVQGVLDLLAATADQRDADARQST